MKKTKRKTNSVHMSTEHWLNDSRKKTHVFSIWIRALLSAYCFWSFLHQSLKWGGQQGDIKEAEGS